MLKKSSTRTKKALPASRVIRTNSGTRIKIERGIEYVLPLGNGWVVKNGGASKLEFLPLYRMYRILTWIYLKFYVKI